MTFIYSIFSKKESPMTMELKSISPHSFASTDSSSSSDGVLREIIQLLSTKSQLYGHFFIQDYDAAKAKEAFVKDLQQMLCKYKKRLFSSPSASSLAMAVKLENYLAQKTHYLADLLALITQFMAFKNMQLQQGKLFSQLLPFLKAGFWMLSHDNSELENFVAIADNDVKSLLRSCFWISSISKITVGDYLMKIAIETHNQYLQSLLMNRGFYPEAISDLSSRLCSIGSFSNVRDSLDLDRSKWIEIDDYFSLSASR